MFDVANIIMCTSSAVLKIAVPFRLTTKVQKLHTVIFNNKKPCPKTLFTNWCSFSPKWISHYRNFNNVLDTS